MRLLTHYQDGTAGNPAARPNWQQFSINNGLLYSFRSTEYDRKTYPSSLHYHDYYELVIFMEGDIQYICEGQTYQPQHGDVILIPPHKLHMSMLKGEQTHYTRHVIYLYPDAFDEIGCSALVDFLAQAAPERTITALKTRERNQLLSLLTRLYQTCEGGDEPRERALALGLIIQIFYLLNQAEPLSHRNGAMLPINLAEMQRYIDEHFTEITSVQEVAEQFFYSREYVSRLFKQYFNTTVSDYITARRIAHSQSLIAQGSTLTEACFGSGFGNMTTFIRCFRSVAGCTPSQYRKQI